MQVNILNIKKLNSIMSWWLFSKAIKKMKGAPFRDKIKVRQEYIGGTKKLPDTKPCSRNLIEGTKPADTQDHCLNGQGNNSKSWTKE